MLALFCYWFKDQSEYQQVYYALLSCLLAQVLRVCRNFTNFAAVLL